MNNQSQVTLKISDIAVRQDAEGRYCLNDLHKSAGSIKKHRPNYFLATQQTIDLINEIEIAGISAIVTKQGVGTFVAKELVYAYGMWISAEFTLKVIRAYDQLQKPQYGLKSLASPFISEAEAAQFKKSIEAFCKSDGKAYPILYRKIYEHYGITSYKNIPAGKLAEAARILGMKLLTLKKQAIPAEPFKLAFTPEELEDLVAERIKSVAGEIMPKQHEEAVQHNSVTISLAPLVDGKHRRWLVTQALDEMTIMQSIRPDQDLRSKTEVLSDVGASKDALKELINQHIPLDLLPWLINLSSERMGDCIQTLRVTSIAAA